MLFFNAKFSKFINFHFFLHLHHFFQYLFLFKYIQHCLFILFARSQDTHYSIISTHPLRPMPHYSWSIQNICPYPSFTVWPNILLLHYMVNCIIFLRKSNFSHLTRSDAATMWVIAIKIQTNWVSGVIQHIFAIKRVIPTV